MIGAYLIEPSRGNYEISALSNDYLDTNIESIDDIYGKGKKKMSYSDVPVDKILLVIGDYCKSVYNLSNYISEILKGNNQEKLFFDIELPLVYILADMEYVGFKVDSQALIKLSAELEVKIIEITKEIYEIANEKFNINSPKQLGVILFEKLGLVGAKKTKTGFSTDAESLEKLESKHIIVEKIVLFRHLMKLKTTYADGLLLVINPATGRIHSSFNQTIAVTGRISSTEPNLQNIPMKLEMGKEIRKVFVPMNSEYTLLDADYSQVELRILAHITEDENMLEAFLNNKDIHTTTAAKVFGVQESDVDSQMRHKAKAVNFGIIYGIGEFSLAGDLKITRKEARKYIDDYLEEYPNVKNYMKDIVKKGTEDGFVTTLFNRRRYLPELKSTNFNIRSFGERIAINTTIQGTAADIIKIAMITVYNLLKEKNLKSRLILQVHDELIIETYKEEKYEVQKILKESMENAAILKCPLKVDLKEGESWYQTK
jgi:DNA polymerase-1